MKVLVVGSGGREHALCWKLRQSPLIEELYCAPGNPGIAAVADCVAIGAEETQKLLDFATDLKIDLTVVGPELPLTLGLADDFAQRGLQIFGPRRQAAELEGSKVFAKELMKRHNIPTGGFAVAHDADEARREAREFGFPVVLKADGLAAGKGVIIAQDTEELDAALDTFFEERRFGVAGGRVVVEEFLEGEEVSFLALVDGEHILPLATSKDYKRLGDGDQGPNTGGMGAHSPAGVLSKNDGSEIYDRIVRPTVQALAEEDRPFVGVLYVGLMLTADGPKVLEYNVRLGDPEAQALLMRLETDLLGVLASGAAGRFDVQRLQFKKEASVCIVLASSGYPVKPVKGEVIQGLEEAPPDGVEIFHAGTKGKDGQIVASGGRVLNVCATAPHLRDALKLAYQTAQKIHWPSKILRHDIGRRVVEKAAG